MDNGSYQYKSSDSTVLAVSGTNVTTAGTGNAYLTVTDKISKISQKFDITVVNAADHYCYVRGDTVIGMGEATILTLISDVNVVASTTSPLISLKQSGTTLKVLAADSMGTATIDFIFDNELISSFTIEVKSIWVV